MKLTAEEVRMLAEAERKMDTGEIPFVMYGGHRAAMRQEAMDHFKLKQGQTINDQIWIAILEFNIAHCRAETDMRKNPN
jgi:hypothetical protein